VSKPYGMACYWIPILCRYTGARITEIAQLKKSDVSQSDTGIYYLNMRRGEGQSIKTDASLRHTPVPQHVIELGFISYVESSSDVLFADLPIDKYGRQASAFTKWWHRLRYLIIKQVTFIREFMYRNDSIITIVV